MFSINPGTIIKISGPLVVARGLSRTSIYDMVRVGNYKLFGEVCRLGEAKRTQQKLKKHILDLQGILNAKL